jgi:hypothetical protein
MFFSKNIFAYDDKVTHPDITERALQVSQLEQYLINNLGFKDGFETKFPSVNPNDAIIDLISKGSTDEDTPMCRASNHFHDPTKSWDQSYVTDQPWWISMWCDVTTGYSTKYSNITWATNFESRGGS